MSDRKKRLIALLKQATKYANRLNEILDDMGKQLEDAGRRR